MRTIGDEVAKENCATALERMYQIVQAEESRLNEIILPDYRSDILSITCKTVIGKHLINIISQPDGLTFMIKNRKLDMLKEMWFLASKDILVVEDLKKMIYEYIKQDGLTLIETNDVVKDPRVYIPKLIANKKYFDLLVSDSFSNDRQVADSVAKGFMTFMSRGELTYRQLANYCNVVVKQVSKTINAFNFEEFLEDFLNLFNCLSNKMLFLRDYGKLLSDRLLKRKSSLVYEVKIINGIKSIIGAADALKLTTMINDIKLTDKIMNNFVNKQVEGIELRTTIIQSSIWYIEETAFKYMKLPPVLTKVLDNFSCFYNANNCLKLNYCYRKAEVEVELVKFNRKYIINMTLVQFLCLYYLEKYGDLSLEKLSEILDIEKKSVAHEIGFLINLAVLRKETASVGLVLVSEGETVESANLKLNREFSSSYTKISVLPMTIKKEDNDDDEKKKKEEDLKMQKYMNDLVDSNLVRIMKGRKGKVTTHQDLTLECQSSINNFNANPTMIKLRIESLLERKIIKRTLFNRMCYEYM